MSRYFPVNRPLDRPEMITDPIRVGIREYFKRACPPSPTCLLLVSRGTHRNQIGTVLFRMISYYSADVTAAHQLLCEVETSDAAVTTADRVFFDRLMAAALRHLSEGQRKHGLGSGSPRDPELIERCEKLVATLAGRTSAPVACRRASNALRSGNATSAAIEILIAAASALETTSA